MTKPRDLMGMSGAVSGHPMGAAKPAIKAVSDQHAPVHKHKNDATKGPKGSKHAPGGIGAIPTGVRPKV